MNHKAILYLKMIEQIKYRPLMFVRDMVHALEEKRKFRTRRFRGLDYINASPDDWVFVRYEHNSKKNRLIAIFKNKNGVDHRVECPYGQRGDGIYVQETFGKSKASGSIVYAADVSEEDLAKIECREALINNRWTGSMFMTIDYARYKFFISDIKLERLKAITDQESMLEGVVGTNTESGPKWKNYIENTYSCTTPRDSFISLIMHVNKNKNHSDVWFQNHWVWVIEWKEVFKE